MNRSLLAQLQPVLEEAPYSGTHPEKYLLYEFSRQMRPLLLKILRGERIDFSQDIIIRFNPRITTINNYLYEGFNSEDALMYFLDNINRDISFIRVELDGRATLRIELFRDRLGEFLEGREKFYSFPTSEYYNKIVELLKTYVLGFVNNAIVYVASKREKGKSKVPIADDYEWLVPFFQNSRTNVEIDLSPATWFGSETYYVSFEDLEYSSDLEEEEEIVFEED